MQRSLSAGQCGAACARGSIRIIQQCMLRSRRVYRLARSGAIVSVVVGVVPGVRRRQWTTLLVWPTLSGTSKWQGTCCWLRRHTIVATVSKSCLPVHIRIIPAWDLWGLRTQFVRSS